MERRRGGQERWRRGSFCLTGPGELVKEKPWGLVVVVRCHRCRRCVFEAVHGVTHGFTCPDRISLECMILAGGSKFEQMSPLARKGPQLVSVSSDIFPRRPYGPGEPLTSVRANKTQQQTTAHTQHMCYETYLSIHYRTRIFWENLCIDARRGSRVTETGFEL